MHKVLRRPYQSQDVVMNPQEIRKTEEDTEYFCSHTEQQRFARRSVWLFFSPGFTKSNQ